MFKLDLSPTYFAPVSLPMLNAEGVLENHQFDARFRRLDTAQVDALMQEGEAGNLKDEPTVRGHMVGWRGVQDADGTEIPFSDDALNKLLAINGARAALARAFLRSLDPQEGAVLTAKN